MMMREYIWGGARIQIRDEDLKNFPGAVPVKTEKAKKAPANKKRRTSTK